jgi:sporulation integral membrane protein YlbJ
LEVIDIKGFITMLFAILFTILLVINPNLSLLAALDAVRLCGGVLIPSLFPFFVFSTLLVSSGAAGRLSRFFSIFMRPLFGLRGVCATPFIVGLLSGYPMGAYLTAEMYKTGSITKTEAQKLLAFSNNSGPLFIIGAVGVGLYGNSYVGYLLYAVHVISAVLTGVVLRFWGRDARLYGTYKKQAAFSAGALPDAVKTSVSTMLNLCGFVIFFAVILKLLEAVGFIGFLAKMLCFAGLDAHTALLLSRGLLEITTALGGDTGASLPAVSCIISMGGMSVLLQTLSQTASSGLSLKSYLYGKLLCGGISAVVCKVFLIFIPQTQAVFAPNNPMLQDKIKIFAVYIISAFIVCTALYGIAFVSEFYDKRKK